METKVRCLRAPRNLSFSSLTPHRESFPLEPTIDTTDIRCRTLRPPGVSKMGSLVKTGLAGCRRVGDGRIRCDDLRERNQCTCVSKQTSLCRQPHSGDGQTIRETPLLGGFFRHCHALLMFPQHTLLAENPLVADAEVDKAFVAFFNEKYRLEYSRPTGDILLGKMCHYFEEVNTSCPAAIAPSRVETPYPAEEQRSHVRSIRTVLILEFSRQRCRSIGVCMLWVVTCNFKPGETLTIQKGDIQIHIQGISSRHRVCL